MSGPQPAEIDALISAHLDGALDDAGHQVLEAWLTADRANQRRFLAAVMDHRALAQQLKADQHPTVRRLRLRPRRRRTARLLAAAALVMFALGGLLWFNAEPPGPRLIIPGSTVAGPRVPAGERIAVKEGHAGGLLYDDGTRVGLDGGSELVVESATRGKRLTLLTGRLSAAVTPQPSGRPFTIATPGTITTVLGTALTVATDGSETEIAVSLGRVAVERAADRARVEVAAGERSTVAADLPLRARSDGAPAGRLLRVGPGQPAATLADLPALAPGDVIELQPGTHRGAWRLTAGGTALRPVTIRGAAGEPPLLDGDGLALTGIGAVPRAVLQLAGGHWRIEHLAFANARNGLNAAAIRLAETRGAVLSDCRIARCDQGVDAVTGDITVEDCDVGFCGTASNDGYGHDLNLSADRALVRGCHLHDQLHGQALRSTCAELTVEACRIVNAEDGEISIATGRRTDVSLIGNLVVSKRERKGNSMRFILAEGEGEGTLILAHNTFAADSQWVTFIAPGRLAVRADANIFSGSGRIALPGDVAGRGNWLPTGAAVPAGFRDGVSGDDPGFNAAQGGDYRLRPDSPCRGKAMPGMVLIPEREPSVDAKPGSRPRRTSVDLGAFAGDG